MQLINPVPSLSFPKNVGQRFGENPAVYAQFGIAGHNGVDIPAHLGTPAIFAHDCWITEVVAKNTGFGLRVSTYFEEDGFGWENVYGHFQSVPHAQLNYDIRNRSRPVQAGQIAGFIDSTGFSTGNHLHLGLRQYHDYQLLHSNNGFQGWINPLPFIKENSMVFVFKNQSSQTVYIELGGKLVPISVTWDQFIADWPTYKLLTIPDATFATYDFARRKLS